MAVAAGCGGSGSSGAVPGSTTSVTLAPVPVTHSVPTPPTTKPTSTPTPPKKTPAKKTTTAPMVGTVTAPTTLPAADLAALQHDLDAAGSSLGGADAALSQTDPNQTAKSEGTTP